LGRPRRLIAALVAAALAAPASASAADCAPQPSNPVGYQVTAVHADQVQLPAATPPIAILDSGVANVPELSGRIRAGADVTTGGQNTRDTDGHGTAVATVAAGQAGGVRGISPTSPIIPIKIFNARGESTAEWVVEGVAEAISRGAGVINISAAGDITGTDPVVNRAVENAFNEAVTSGIPVIAPSGNEGAPKLDIPASYAHVIAVGATDESNLVADFSNTGAGLDLAAPGASITSAAPQFLCSTGYAIVSGTSFSAPAVAGAAALLLAQHPGLDPTQLTDMLRLHGPREPAPAWGPGLGFGLLDVPAVLAAPVPPADAPEVDDDVTWAKRHPPVLTTSTRSRAIAARVATHTDPADTFRLRLRKGDRLRAVLKATGARLALSLSNGHRVIARGNPLRTRVKKSGTYYVSVAVRTTPPAGVDYTLALRRL
jgi:subtilisin family serine protease